MSEFFDTRELTPSMGVELLGVDLSVPPTDEIIDDVRDTLYQHALLLFRGQDLEPSHIVEWSRRFGELERFMDTGYLLEGYDEIVVIGNRVVNGELRSLFVNGTEEWHFDYAFSATPSCGALFYALRVPPVGGDTLFADMRTAYDVLDDDTKRQISKLHAVYSYEFLDQHLRSRDPSRPPMTDADRRKWPPVAHPIVHTHPQTGDSALRLAPQIITHIEGIASVASHQIVETLVDHATQPQFVYRHRWREGDLVIFDNNSLMHSATQFDTDQYVRVMYRTTIMG
jgi:taurine dioxygenase